MLFQYGIRALGDEDIIGVHDDYTCLSWKELLSLTDVHYKVNSFLVINNVCVYENVILPKPINLCMIRFTNNTNMDGGEEARSTRRRRGKQSCCHGKQHQGNDISVRTGRSPEFEIVMDSSYGLQIKQGSTIRKGNSKSFPMNPAPSTDSTRTRRGDRNKSRIVFCQFPNRVQLAVPMLGQFVIELVESNRVGIG